jgi:hypothetical protein
LRTHANNPNPNGASTGTTGPDPNNGDNTSTNALSTGTLAAAGTDLGTDFGTDTVETFCDTAVVLTDDTGPTDTESEAPTADFLTAPDPGFEEAAELVADTDDEETFGVDPALLAARDSCPPAREPDLTPPASASASTSTPASAPSPWTPSVD